MRVMHVGIGNLGPGGVSTYLRLVSSGQSSRGWEVSISELWPVPGSTTIATDVFHSLSDLDKGMREFSPDVVHLHSLIPSYAGIGSKSVITAHDHSSHCPAGSRYLERTGRACTRPFSPLGCFAAHYIDRCGTRNPSRLRNNIRLTRESAGFEGHWIAPSSYARDQMARRGLEPARIHHIANPSPFPVSPLPRPTPGAIPHFLFVGRLVANKGVSIAIEALSRTSLPVRLVVVGEGPQKPELERLASDLGVGDRVDFLGWCPPERVIEQLDRCDGLVVPSLWPEPFGLVALEAFSRKCPVIASNTGGLSDLVRGGASGFLVPPGNPEALAGSMASLLEEPIRTAAMAEVAAGELATRFSLDIHLDRLEQVYGRVQSPAGFDRPTEESTS